MLIIPRVDKIPWLIYLELRRSGFGTFDRLLPAGLLLAKPSVVCTERPNCGLW